MPVISNVTYEELPPWMKQPYKNMVEQAEAYAQQSFQPYGGVGVAGADERLAPIPEEIRDAQRFIRETVGREQPILAESGRQIRQGVRPFHENAAQYMNPYQQHVVRQIAEEGNRNFTENVLPALEARFVRLGQHGSSRHADLSLRAARDLQHEILNRQQQALAQGYQQAGQMYNAQQARQLEGASQLGNLATTHQGTRLADIAALENVGRYRQQQQQAHKDIMYQNWLREQEHPMYRMQQQAAIMQGMPAQGINQSYYQTPATPAMNVIGQLGPLAGAILGTRMMSGGR